MKNYLSIVTIEKTTALERQIITAIHQSMAYIKKQASQTIPGLEVAHIAAISIHHKINTKR